MNKIELKDELAELKRNITNEDKYNTALSLGCSVATIERYLNGKISKPSFAKVLIQKLNEQL